ncbi:MAG: HD domain-containing phosphohydrolase [Verrucomicrobiota bacterium]|jgi:response regulator RpfG family c-di-GMP phosphodiesterase
MKKILFVDDEPNVLSAIQRQLHQRFEVETAVGPIAGLEALQNGGDYSVVVADMGMPKMSGVEFLAKACEMAPDIVRVMLTGYLNQATAVEAINQGSIFRFLNKPCSTEKLVQTLEAAVAQHNLITAERDLLENTLGGSLKILSEILALAEPKAFGQAEALRDAIRLLAGSLNLTPTWHLEAAALLSQIGSVTIPPELILKSRLGHPLSAGEKEIFNHIPEVGSSLLAQIPRLEGVARIILYQNKNFDGSGFPEDSVAGEAIPVGARMLKILVDIARLESGGLARPAALAQLRARAGRYDPRLLDALEHNPGAAAAPSADPALAATTVAFVDLRVGHVLRRNLETKGNMLLVTAGNKITPMLMHRLRNFSSLYGIQEPIYIEETGAGFFTRSEPKPAKA